MTTTYRAPVRRVGALDQHRIAVLLTVYREALEELRSWDDPAVSELIERLEALRRLVARRAQADL